MSGSPPKKTNGEAPNTEGEAIAKEMWNSEDAVDSETSPLSSDASLQQPVGLSKLGQVCATEETPFLCGSVLGQERKAEQSMDQSAELHGNLTSQGYDGSVDVAVSMATHDSASPNTACQAAETECLEKPQDDIEASALSLDPDADLDPDYDPEVDPQGLCIFPCQHCQRRFTTKQGLERHGHIHAATTCQTQPFKCRHCAKAFSTQFGRRRHERRHDNTKNKPESVIGSTCSTSPSLQSESENPGVITVSCVGMLTDDRISESPEAVKPVALADVERTVDVDDSGEPKGSHICKYCKKIFGTHTNLRRHQRRVHERHLLPKGSCRKGRLVQEVQSQKQQAALTSGDSPSGSPQPIYLEEEGDQEEEYMVDISSNISENLSFYIDGKIVSTSAISNCEVMEVNSGSAAVIGLDALIISPAQITQALKIDAAACAAPEVPGQPAAKRRTSTPPLLPQIKTELESESILATSSPGSSSLSSPSLSSSTAASVGAGLPQAVENIAFHKEKTVYLSPKLKQLLQSQDGSRPMFALITDGQKLGPPLSLTVLPATSGRFKRRTTSPPNLLQQTSSLSATNATPEAGFAVDSKVVQTESHCSSPGFSSSSREETSNMSPLEMDSATAHPTGHSALPTDGAALRTGGSPCNQQPLDLSTAVGKRVGDEALAEAVLDLSMHRKNPAESESTGGGASQVVGRRTKPNSSMLQKVLMNEYAGADGPAVDGAGVPEILRVPVVAADLGGVADPPPVLFELALPPAALHPPPPLLTPISIQPVSPLPVVLGSPTPPPPVLPSASSPPATTPNPEPPPNSAAIHSSIPVLSPIMPANIDEVPIEKPLQTVECGLNVTLPNWMNSSSDGLTHTVIPTTPSFENQDSALLTNPSLCEIAQRTFAVDSVIASETQIFSPALTVNESNINTLSFAPNTVVIEYTVSLESSENVVSALQANAVPPISAKPPLDHTELHEPPPSSHLQSHVPALAAAAELKPAAPSTPLIISPENPADEPSASHLTPTTVKEETVNKEEVVVSSDSHTDVDVQIPTALPDEKTVKEESSLLDPHCKLFMCNVCDEPFQSMKGLSHHIGEHAELWPYKCEFCVQLFESDSDLLEHRSSYHGVGKIYICSACSKEFAFLCNLERHHKDLHPGQTCSHTEVENGKLRPENHNSPAKSDPVNASISVKAEAGPQSHNPATKDKEEGDFDASTEELYTTIKIMASEGLKPKGPDVRLGINQHYPSFKPPPFPYHNRSPAGSVASATNFTTHNIPQTFSTAIRCTKCGNSFDNMPELHKHILACANASDKRRYTPKKNPIPLRQFAKAQNGVLSPARAVNSRQNVSQKVEPAAKLKVNALSKKKSQLLQKAISQRSKSATTGKKGSGQEELEVYVCRHCSREFTYHASLKKHMAVSCPQKPVSKNAQKRKGAIALAQENNGNLRSRAADVTKPHGSNHGQKTLGKYRGSGPALDIRPKRPAILSTSVIHPNKKSKPSLKGDIQLQQTAKLTVLSPVPPARNSSQGAGTQGVAKDNAPPGTGARAQGRPPSKREERFSLRVRERAGGPVTRSLQQSAGEATGPVLEQADSPNTSQPPGTDLKK